VWRSADAANAEGTDKNTQTQEEPNFFQQGVAFLSGVLGSLFSLMSAQGDQQHERPARIVQQLGQAPIDAQQDAPVYSLGPVPRCTEASNLRNNDRHFTIVTTAMLPWRTGPAVNALLRALYLARRGHPVVMLLPWVSTSDQELLFAGDGAFPSSSEQEEYIRQWCKDRVNINLEELPITMRWYEATYVKDVRSIFPSGDPSEELGDDPKDVLILEEPEHLCWYHNGQRWPELFKHVIGVVHTNYKVYLEGMGYNDLIMGTAGLRDSVFFTFTSLVCSAYCDVTIKLSAAGISLPNEVICNIHGVRDEFLEIGKKAGEQTALANASPAQPKAYFLAKSVLQKGWENLLRTLEDLPSTGEEEALRLDLFGSGPDRKVIAERAAQMNHQGRSKLRLFAGADHADERFQHYSVLVNPSTTEMLCTVTAEALAMGKRVVLPRHPSNEFFKAHFLDRCHFYAVEDPASFVAAVRAAEAAGPPQPLPAHSQAILSWDAALERLIGASEVRVLSGAFSRPSQVASARLAYDMHKGIQTEMPQISDLLKESTLRTDSQSPWIKYMAKQLQSSMPLTAA